MKKKHNRLIVIGDGIVYRCKNDFYVAGSSQLDIYNCFEGIDEVIIWSRIYDISEQETKKYSKYDTSAIDKKITFCGIYNQPPGLMGYAVTLAKRIKKLNQLFNKPALVICAPISVSQWIMWFFFRKRDLIFISRVIGDISGLAEFKKPKFFWIIVVGFIRSIQKNYFSRAVLQTWVSNDLEKRYRNPNTPSIVFHDGLIRNSQIAEEIRYRNDEDLQLIYVGRLSPEKGIHDLIEAMYALSNNQIKLKIVGEGNEAKNIRTHIKKRNLQDTISMEGAKKWGEELFAEIRTAHVLVLPSYNEGLGMVLLEAMSNGLTVVASNVGGIPDIVKSGVNGLLFSPGNISELAYAINQLYEQEDVRQTMCKNALIIAHKNSRETQLKKFKSAYMKYVHNKL